MKVKIKYVHDDARMPTQAYEDAAAWDVYAVTTTTVNTPEYGYIEYGTGLAFEIPTGYVGKLFPRSSVSKTGLILSNCVGIIDPDFRGEVTFRYKWVPGSKRYNVGDAIGQIRIEKTIPVEWELSDTLSDTTRGDNGYGSSDKQEGV